MPGAGSATLAFGIEDSFAGSVVDQDSSGNPSYFSFGRNPTVQDLSLDNQLERLREAGAIENVAAIKTNFEGAFGVEAVANEATFNWVNSVVFNAGSDGSPTGFTTGRARSATVQAGSEYLASTGTDTKVRALKGVVPTDFEISYEQGDMVRYTLTCLYADEQDGTEPTDLTRPAGGDDTAFHNADFAVDGVTVNKLQSATLSFSNLYRMQRDADPTAVQAVLSAPETSLDTEAVFEGTSYLERAYGDLATTSPNDRLTGVSATVNLSISGTTVATYELVEVKPDTYEWASLLDPETDTTDPVSWIHSGQTTVTT
jgi:hypothetical protein